eukprot:606464-Alexandrium_andersonii.AAC.1
MSASLVGSEMCIRDSPMAGHIAASGGAPPLRTPPKSASGAPAGLFRRPVSYTHLTLPTICSV